MIRLRVARHVMRHHEDFWTLGYRHRRIRLAIARWADRQVLREVRRIVAAQERRDT